MSQSSVVNNSKSSDSQLPQALKAVLGSLDVQLEDELSRYRRYRRAHSPAPAAKPSNSYTQKPSEVLSVSEGENNIEPTSSAPTPESKSSRSQTPSGWEAVVLPESAPLARRSLTKLQSEPHPTASSVTSSSIPNSEPEGYLESSQNLVKSLEQRRARRRQRSWVASLLTPVGIGSMLLFLLSCIGLGYVVMSPSGMATLGLNRWFKFNQNAETANQTSDENAVAQPVEPQPNLAAREFVELDLDTLSNINPSPNPIPTPATQTPPSPDSQSLTPPSPLPSGPGMNNLTNELLPDPVLPTPTPQPTPTAAPTVTPTPAAGAATKPNTDPVRASDNLYYVVTSYTDQRSLEKAREVVPDAYVREFKTGVKVQMGALDNPEAAKRLAEELRVQGISVQYDTPKTAE
ncbi:MAG: hypothetical protein VKK42_21415 [Lyngbya sp.]|nr:hypothetical protein [Lyngbya sp.]